jgi:hypothetical protein
VKYCKKGETAKEVGKIFEARHYENLLKQKCRGKTFYALGNSKASSFFISNPRVPNADSLIRFTLRARNDTLWTSPRKAMIFKEKGSDTSCSCGNRRFCDLLHILNNCVYNLNETAVRHNMIQEVLVEAIKKHRKINTEEMLTNKEIDFGKFKNELGKSILKGEEVWQRPDIQFWANISKEDDIIETWKLIIVEIAVPFGRDKEDVHSNALKNATEPKTNRYAPRVRSINKQLMCKNFTKKKFAVEFLPFIISSLGALPNKSINNLIRMIGTATKNTVGLWSNILIVKALKGSFMI